VIDLKAQWCANTVLIEDKSSGQALLQELRRDGFPAIPIAVEGDKITRFAAQTSVIEQGRVFLPRNAEWLANFMQELLQFPAGKYNDQVDSVSQFLKWAESHVRREFW
jgi:predicted phage terminase large subunit-like protein